MAKTFLASDLGIDLSRFAAREFDPDRDWIYLEGRRPWSRIDFPDERNEAEWLAIYGDHVSAARAKKLEGCPICASRPLWRRVPSAGMPGRRGRVVCAGCGQTSLEETEIRFPGEPVGSRLNKDYPVDQPACVMDEGGLAGGTGKPRKSA